MLAATGYKDCACAELLGEGPAFLGEMERSGIGTPVDAAPVKADHLREGVRERNALLPDSLVENAHSHELLRTAKQDAGLGRMSTPEKLGAMPWTVCAV